MTATTKQSSENNWSGVDSSLLNKQDYLWVKTDEPHWERKKQLLAKYPQIKQLYTIDPTTKYKILLLVLIQFITCYYVVAFKPAWYITLACMWIIGGTCNTSLTVGIHELTHGVGFETLEYNYMMAIFGNLPLAVPFAMSFKRYHHEHHVYQGVLGLDTDIGTPMEAKFFSSRYTKFLHVLFMVFFYALRPLYLLPRPPQKWELINQAVIFTFVGLITYLFGWMPLIYFLGSDFFGLGLHPLAGHFISEHFVTRPGQETYSYYGIGNLLMFNVGYHNEHHDFPKIPGCHLPKLKEMAPEFYNNLKTTESWSYALWEYITTDGFTPYNRVTRTREDHLSSRKKSGSNRPNKDDEMVEDACCFKKNK